MRHFFAGLCGVGLVVLLAAPSAAPAADDTVVVGISDTIFPGLSGPRLQKAIRPFKSLLESAMGRTGKVVQGGDALELADKLKADKVQMGVFQGFEYAWARQKNPKLEPLVICVNRDRTRRALLVVRAGSSYRKPDDLRDRVLDLPAEVEEHCKLFLRRKCVPEGTPPNRFYKKIARPADTEETLDDVVDGKAQAAVVDGLAWRSYRDSKPGAARKLRVLLESEPFPCPVIAVQQGRSSAADVKRIRDWLVDAKNKRRGKQLLEQLRLTGFEIMPAGYNRILDDIARDYPPPKK